MPKYAIIENNSVVNVAMAGAPLDANWIESDMAGPGWTYSNGVFSAPVAPLAPVVADPCEWLIDHMPLLDRFGPELRLAFLECTIPRVVALRMDYFARKWLDMQNTELQGGFYFMAGVAVPVLGAISAPLAGLTPAIVASVFGTPALPSENNGLRKVFFA